MPTIDVWAVDFLETYPGVCLGDFWEQDIASNHLGFLPDRPSLALMVMVQDYVRSRTSNQRRKLDNRCVFAEWQARRVVCASNYSTIIAVNDEGQDMASLELPDVLLTEPSALDQLQATGIDVLEQPGAIPFVFEPDTLEARLVYAVFDILHQQVMRRKR